MATKIFPKYFVQATLKERNKYIVRFFNQKLFIEYTIQLNLSGILFIEIK